MEWDPKAGMTIESHGSPASVSVLTQFALMRAMMNEVKPEKQNPDSVYTVLVNALKLAHGLYKAADITTFDLNEMRKQAQDADQ